MSLTFEFGSDGINVGHTVNKCAEIILESSFTDTERIAIVCARGNPSPRVLFRVKKHCYR